jgi:hypothetical protein
MRRILFTTILIFASNVFALTPFSLEGVKELNIKVLDKSKLTSEQTLDKIKNSVQTGLKNLNIKTKSDKFSNFIVKIQGEKFDQQYALHISMFIVEESYPLRNKDQETMSITYYKEDFFESNHKTLQEDIFDSVIYYLLEDMSDQYKAENG